MKNRRHGVVLLLVLVVVTMLTLGSLVFADLMLGEHRAAQAFARKEQARCFAKSGAELARQFLDRTADDQLSDGGLYDNSQRFANQLVANDDSARQRGRFTIIAPKIEDTGFNGVRNGLQDESAKINLAALLNWDKPSGISSSAGAGGTPTSGSASTSGATSTSGSGASSGDESGQADESVAKTMLMGLPNMTADVADAILDYIDTDDNPRDQGAEIDYYSSLPHGYAPRNAPPVSIEELLLVRGVTPELLFGQDAAKMGYSGSGSTDGTLTGIDNSDGSMDHGWAAYLTLWSSESTLMGDGSQKINLNDKDLATLYTSLSSTLDQSSADFIIAYRLGGGTLDSSGHIDTSTLENAQAINTISSPLDLIGVTVRGQGTTGSQNAVKNPFTSDPSAMSDYLPKLFEYCTTVTPGKSIPGRININQAPRVILQTIPGMTSDMVEQIIANRQPDLASSSAQATHTCPAWPLIEGVIPLETMKKMMPYINAGGSVFRAQVIGHFERGTPVSRLEVILDATQHPTRVLFWKEMGTGGFPGETSAALGER
jgi:DNA uptake protein ComE-like DNA-binding protein